MFALVDRRDREVDPDTELHAQFVIDPFADPLLEPESEEEPAKPPLPPLSPALDFVRSALAVLSILTASVAMHLVVVSGIQHQSSQHRAYDRFRAAVAEGVAPTGAADAQGHALAAGTPVAFLDMPSIGVHEVVSEGTSASDLMAGPGHRRDTPLPGQAGTSVVFGRQAAYGGPFNRLKDLEVGAEFTATTGQAASRYRVISVRYSGDFEPPALAPGHGRLLLITGSGASYLPKGVLRVDADLISGVAAPPSGVALPHNLPASEQVMGIDPSTLWALVMWMQALIIVVAAMAWSWRRWGRVQTWIVFVPVLFLVALSASSQALRLLPNLL